MTRWLEPARRAAHRLARRLLRRQIAINASFAARLTQLEESAARPSPEAAELRERLERLEQRQHGVEERADTSLALGWDHVALVRRLAQIEDRLSLQEEAGATPESVDGTRAA